MLTKNRTKNTDLNPFREKTSEELEAEQRQKVIDQAIDHRAKELRREQARQPKDQRLNQDQCFLQAEQEVHAEIKKAQRAEKARQLRADLGSAATRNKHLIQPWMVGASYAAAGELGAVLSTADASIIGTEFLAAAGAAAVSRISWKHIKKLPSKYASRLQAGLVAGCATCLSLPILPWDFNPFVLAGGAAALIASCAQYWRDHEPAYPPPGGEQDVSAVAVAENVTAGAETEVTEADDLIGDWNTYVRDTNILPGAELMKPVPHEHGWTFTVQLVRSKQKFENLQRAMSDIAYALNVPVSDLSCDPADRTVDPNVAMTEPTLTVTTSRPDTTYTGPRIVREGRDVYIEVGPYNDGKGVVRHHVLADQLTEQELAAGHKPAGSVMGGFVLGDKGSGKSRFLEALALGHRELGIEVWWLDPLGATSSPLLSEHADWSLSGVDSHDGRSFGNVQDLVAALEGVCQVRKDEHWAWGWSGFQHTRERPAIVVFIDECHIPFDEYGDLFEEIDRISRKYGVALLGASQDPTQRTFGARGALRRGMCATNAYALKYGGSNAGLAFPAYDGQPLGTLPERRGFGYSVAGPRPHALFQNRYTKDLEPYFKARPSSALDEMATIGAGEAYRRRHEAAQQNLAAVQQRLQGYKDGTLAPGQQAKAKKVTTTTNGHGVGPSGDVSYMFPGTQPENENAATSIDALTARQRQILGMLADSQLNAKNLAVELGVTNRTISSDLKVLREAKFVRVVDEVDGRYAVAEQV